LAGPIQISEPSEIKKPNVTHDASDSIDHDQPPIERHSIDPTSGGSVDDIGDPLLGKRLSAQATPFSEASYQSSSFPGPELEVSQATAVSIFPHQNKSLLVVQQQAKPYSASLPNSVGKQGPSVLLNGVTTKDPKTPPMVTSALVKRTQVDSPLRNPRSPPKPPAFKIIPPTPANEEEKHIGTDQVSLPGRGMTGNVFSLVRRSLSNRTRSDFINSFTRRRNVDGSSSARHAASPHHPYVGDLPEDSKLHPFWRPRGFWDDLSDDEDDDYPEESMLIARPLVSRSNSWKRTFAIIPIQDNHTRVIRKTSSGHMRVVKRSVHKRRESERRLHTIPGLGVQIEYVGWKGIQDKVREKRMMRSERKKEKKREGLRKSIGAPILVEQNSVN
jgi:hypothetical protein